MKCPRALHVTPTLLQLRGPPASCTVFHRVRLINQPPPPPPPFPLPPPCSYVGGAPGKIDLYVGKEVVRRAIDNDKACDELIDLIKVGTPDARFSGRCWEGQWGGACRQER